MEVAASRMDIDEHGREDGLLDFLQSQEHSVDSLRSLQKLIRKVINRTSSKAVLFVLDDADRVRSEVREPIFQIVRSLDALKSVDGFSLDLVVTGTTFGDWLGTPYDVISPLDLVEVHLRPFDVDDVASLAEVGWNSNGLRMNADAISEATVLTGGVPFDVQRLLHAVFDSVGQQHLGVITRDMVRITWENYATGQMPWRTSGSSRQPDEASQDTDTDSGMVQKVITRLSDLPSGSASAEAYHNLMFRAIDIVFDQQLVNNRKEQEIHEGRKRVDMVFRNAAHRGFFADLRENHEIKCPWVYFECKNYSSDPVNPELDQLVGRLGRRKGWFGVLLCREISNRKRMWLRCRDVVNEGRGYVIALDDNDIIRLLELRKHRDFDKLNEYLHGLLEKLLF